MSGQRRLPGILAAIDEISGRDMALDVALQFGGEEIYLPTPSRIEDHPHHAMLAMLGESAAAELLSRQGGCTIYIPMARGEIAAALAARGESDIKIAERIGRSVRTVRRYRR